MEKNFRQFDRTASRTFNVVMNELRFASDPKKARANMDKHGVFFEEARSVFHCSESTCWYLISRTGYQDCPDTTGRR